MLSVPGARWANELSESIMSDAIKNNFFMTLMILMFDYSLTRKPHTCGDVGL
jgi:hypothetical protein